MRINIAKIFWGINIGNICLRINIRNNIGINIGQIYEYIYIYGDR